MHDNRKVTISIIVPVYNVSGFLRGALDSAVNQTVRDIEIIVVNDCSPDPLDTEIMCEYAQKYPDIIRLFFHEHNRGLGGARNTGIREARGEYILFLDGDDKYMLDACEKFYECAKATNADVIRADFLRNGKPCKLIIPVKETRFDIDENFIFFDATAWSLLISRNLLIDNNLFFEENLYHEDLPFCYMLYILSKKTVKLDSPLYEYVQRKLSITNRFNDRNLTDLLKGLSIFKNSAKDLTDYDTIKGHIDVLCFTWIYSLKYNDYYLHLTHDALNMLNEYISDFNCDFHNALFLKRYGNNGCDFLDAIKNSLPIETIIDKFHRFLFSPEINLANKVIGEMKFNDNNNIIVWGCGEYGKRFLNAISYQDNNLTYLFTDSNPKLHGTMFGDWYLVRPFEEIKELSNVIVIAVRNRVKKGLFYADEIKHQIQALENKYCIYDINDYIELETQSDIN